MRNFILLSLLVQALVFNTFAAPNALGHSSQNETFYNELYENGVIRDIYKPIEHFIKSLSQSKAEVDEFLRSSRKAFQNDNALDPVPRILSQEEANTLQRGVRQRGLAIQMFLKDHYSGKKSYIAGNVIPKDIVDRIIMRAGDIGYAGLVDSNDISFMYGPDVIRDRQGTWRVIEDNPGFIGGLGDLQLAYDLMVKKHPQLFKDYQFADPKRFYSLLAQTYREKAAAHGGKAIMFMTFPSADNEDLRLKQILEKEGIQTVVSGQHVKLSVEKDGVYTVDQFNRKEKVGYIFMNGEHTWLDSSHRASKIREVLEWSNEIMSDNEVDSHTRRRIEKILAQVDPKTNLPDIDGLYEILKHEVEFTKKSRNPGLIDAILTGKVGSNYTPGIDFIGDKEFYVYVEKLIKYYLKEDPIIKNIPTEKLADANKRADESLLKKIRENKKDYVIKKVDGRGGDAVWVGSKVSDHEFSEVIEMVRKNPDVYIAQKFTHLSVMGENIVDLRALSAIFPDKMIVAETPWGRGLPMNGNGKVNLSDKGREVTVLVVKSGYKSAAARQCRNIFKLAM